MKKAFLIFLSFILALSCFACRNESDADEARNDPADNTYNLGFEEGMSGWISGSDFCEILNTSGHNGSRCLQIGSENPFAALVHKTISGLSPGYYYIEVYSQNEGNEEYCYVYGKGSKQEKCMTSVPVNTDGNNWTVTTVRGICVEEDGELEIGFAAKGDGQFALFDDIKFTYEKNQEEQYASVFGGCISWLDWEEDSGAVYYDENGTPFEITFDDIHKEFEKMTYQEICDKINSIED